MHGAAYSRVAPTPVSAPTTLAWSPEVAELLGLDPSACASADFAQVLGGNRVPKGADTFAACYGGHQFGNWAGQLGDGRAIALGAVVDRHGRHQVLQLKGAGPTPYSRGADGRAVLRSSLREYLCSEALHHLGIPTTRALSLVATGDAVVRDVLYDGHPAPEPGAVVCRVAPSFTRFGTFELPASRGDVSLLRRLVEVTIAHDFPHLDERGLPPVELVGEWFSEVCDRTASLVVDWMRVGFVHGVLNTDNMSILGLTIDYGPYGWLESFDPAGPPTPPMPAPAATATAPNRRWRIGTWPSSPTPCSPSSTTPPCSRPASTATGSSTTSGSGPWWSRDSDGARGATATRRRWRRCSRSSSAARWTRSFSSGTSPSCPSTLRPATTPCSPPSPLPGTGPRRSKGDVRDETVSWLRSWAARAVDGGLGAAERRRRMDALNPRYVLRNYLAHEAIEAARGRRHRPAPRAGRRPCVSPTRSNRARRRFAARRPDWARHRVGCSMLSCSS